MACTIEQFGDWLCNKRAIGIATLKSKLEDMIRGGKACVIGTSKEDIPGDPKVRLYPEARKREGKESQDRLTAIAKNKLGFVDGSIVAPDVTVDEFKFSKSCKNLAISWLLANLDDTIAKSVLFFHTAAEIWQDLDERYGFSSMAQIYSLEQQLLEINQGTDSISESFTKIKTLWDGINNANPLPYCTCNAFTFNLSQRLVQRQQEHRVLHFMMKLSEQYALVRGNDLMMQPLPIIA
ncbi:hypothetical protein AgCh_033256 [Apium graveolens]